MYFDGNPEPEIDVPEYDEIDAGCDAHHEDSDEAMIAEIEDGE